MISLKDNFSTYSSMREDVLSVRNNYCVVKVIQERRSIVEARKDLVVSILPAHTLSIVSALYINISHSNIVHLRSRFPGRDGSYNFLILWRLNVANGAVH